MIRLLALLMAAAAASSPVNRPLGPIGSHKFRYIDLGPAEDVQVNDAGSLMVIREGGLGSMTEIDASGHSINLPPISDNLTRIGASIDNKSDVVGEVGSGYVHPALWRNGKLLLLGGFTFQTKSSAVATGISNGGSICGQLLLPDGRTEAGTFTLTTFAALPHPTNAVSTGARAVTPNGVIVGWYVGRDGGPQSVVWRHRRCITLPSLKPSTHCVAYAGNASGCVVGASGRADLLDDKSVQFATLWRAGKPFSLASLGGNNSSAVAINGYGWAVGNSATVSGDHHAVAWDGTGGVHDLNAYVPTSALGVTLEEADQVNDHGCIVGQSMVDGQRHGFELLPIGNAK